jgi:6-phosphogluconate dehydrogenase
MSRRLMKAGHDCVVYARAAKTREALVKDGALEAVSAAGMVNMLTHKPCAIWLMLPAGQTLEDAVAELGAVLEPEGIILDGGNSFYKDDIGRANMLTGKGIRYVACGMYGGVWGIARGCCYDRRPQGGRRLFGSDLVCALAPGLGAIARTPGA